jgi:hypothetical protein
MLARGLAVCSLLLALGASASASVMPTLDGTVNPGEYAFTLNDTPAETGMAFYNTGLDISALQFSTDLTWGYMALTVVAPPLDTNGSPLSLRHKTDFWTIFSNAAGTTPLYYLDVVMNSGGVESVSLEHFDGVSWLPIALTPGTDYEYALGSALEIKFLVGTLGLPPSAFSVTSQLDDTGGWPDDQITGVVPEPLTLSLMGLGAAGLWLRRRTQPRA